MFVQKPVEYTIEQGGLDDPELGEECKQIQSLEQVIAELRKAVKQKYLVIEKPEVDLQEYRREPFTEEEFEGDREYDEKLVALLREGGTTRAGSSVGASTHSNLRR